MIIIAAIATFFNFAIILWKIRNQRWLDASIDGTILFIICILTAGSVAGMQMGMIASMLMSVYLLIFPPKFNFE